MPYKEDMIDLGREYDPMCSPCANDSDKKEKSKMDYPSLSVYGIDHKVELPDDEFYFMAVGKKVRCEESENEKGEKKYGFTVEVKAIQPMGTVEDADEGEDEEDVEVLVASLTKAPAIETIGMEMERAVARKMRKRERDSEDYS